MMPEDKIIRATLILYLRSYHFELYEKLDKENFLYNQDDGFVFIQVAGIYHKFNLLNIISFVYYACLTESL